MATAGYPDNTTPQVKLTGLAEKIRRDFQVAYDFKKRSILPDLEDSQQRRAGIYSNDMLTALKSVGGSTTYFPITRTKCRAAQAWVMDVLNSGKPWALEPTPVSDMPQSALDEVAQEVATELQATTAVYGGQPLLPEFTKGTAEKFYVDKQQKLNDEAADRVKRMEDLIHDQMVEGGFFDAMSEVVADVCTFSAGIMKLETRMEKKLLWKGDVPTVELQEIKKPRRVSPYDLFATPNASTTLDGDLFEDVKWSRAGLQSMRGVDGYNSDAIDRVLSKTTFSVLERIFGDESTRNIVEGKDITANDGLVENTTEAIEYWGRVEGKLLKEWGLEVDSETDYYEICALLIGDEVVRAILNPDTFGNRPYYVTSFERVNGSLWGISLPTILKPYQDGFNAAMRNANNNAAFAARPMFFVDLDLLDPGETANVYPGKVFNTRGRNGIGNNRSPVTPFQVTNVLREMLDLAEFYNKEADEAALIPRYSQGSGMVKGAGETASGMSMIMEAASKGIRLIVYNIYQYIISPYVQSLYYDNLFNSDDPWIKGDARVLPQGVVGEIAKENTQQSIMQFMAQTNNPTDTPLLGTEGRKVLLKREAELLGFPVNKMFPENPAPTAPSQVPGMPPQEAGAPEPGADQFKGSAIPAPGGNPFGAMRPGGPQ